MPSDDKTVSTYHTAMKAAETYMFLDIRLSSGWASPEPGAFSPIFHGIPRAWSLEISFGAWNGAAGIGFSIRNHQGHIIKAGAAYALASSPCIAELHAVH